MKTHLFFAQFLKRFSEQTVKYPVVFLGGIQFEIQLVCRLVPLEAVPFDFLVSAAYRNTAELPHYGFANAVASVFRPDIKVFNEHAFGAEYGRVVIEEHREPHFFSV